MLSISASQVQSVDVKMDAGTIALVAGRQGKIAVEVGGKSAIDISGGAQVSGNKLDIRSNNTVRGTSTLSGYSVRVAGSDVSKHTVRPTPSPPPV
ncbi:hypothetical protein G6F50_017863 [Rhizopus delemar]|uniref:Uncharacterized protein n=1 Tax=Rhizopus delemar TaxID=936053 RepID=A0A9P6XNU9_9FUNG|nr:hypothetical protein G6F50_017863 [Rhizopus delemar]